MEKAKQLLEQIKTAIQAARGDALPKSALAKACNYTLTFWQRLNRFFDYPVLELSNNLAENAISPVVLVQYIRDLYSNNTIVLLHDNWSDHTGAARAA